jgi:uncharacterized protein YndB with AHSA1/START domain
MGRHRVIGMNGRSVCGMSGWPQRKRRVAQVTPLGLASSIVSVSHTDVGRATVEASAHEVFAALVDAEARTIWLPPAGMSGRFDWFDATPGGGYRMTLSYDDEETRGKSTANTDVVEVRFIAVDEPRRVVEEVDFVSDDPDFAGTMTMTWSLQPVDGRTRVTVTATGVPDGISSEDHVMAFASTLSNLNQYVQRGRAS